MNKFYCLMFSGIPFRQEIVNDLIDMARYMYREGKEKYAFTMENYEGELRSSFSKKFVSSAVNGMYFEANLECEEGETLVQFLVPMTFLNSHLPSDWHGKWKRYDPDHPSANAHLN